MNPEKAILIILDGWGVGKKQPRNAIVAAKTPNFDFLKANYPFAQLKASGPAVGLPAGIMGNSEVGHLILGAGRVIDQDLVKINKACQDNSLLTNQVLLEAINQAKKSQRSLHFIGLVSDAGVHSNDKHLYKMCDLAARHGLKRVFIHAITDGRDTDPRSGQKFILNLEKHLKKSTGQIASVIGRYYAMDRDQRWERIKQAYDLLVKGQGQAVSSFKTAIKQSYQQGITDEFIKPLIKADDLGRPLTTIKTGDVVICFNFRTERLRQLTTALTQKNFPKLAMKKLFLHYYTLTKYDNFRGVKVIFNKDNIKDTVGEVVAKNKLSQLRLAETEKYAHVTFFFSGGQEKLFPKEDRQLIPSPKVTTYDLQPEMSASKVSQAAVRAINKQVYNFICINFANGDMVGHTGVFPAIVKAIETVDTCLGEVVAAALKNNYQVLITADHGNAESAVNSDGSPNTAHSLNPVPCLLISAKVKKINSGGLANIAPTILKMMNLKAPRQMTAKPLF